MISSKYAAAGPGKESGMLSMEIGRLNLKAFTVMCFQFSTILDSGLPVARSVRLVAEETKNSRLRQILDKVAFDIEAGKTLADSFEKRGQNKIPATFIEIVRAGEESGNLSYSFSSLAEHYDKQTKIRQKIRSMVAYPIFVLAVAIAVVVVMMLVVIPAFNRFFASFGGSLPWMTQALIDTSSFIGHNLLWIFLILAILVTGYKLFEHSAYGGKKIAWLKLKLPVIGKLQMLKGAAEFSSSMSVMTRSGLPLTRAVSVTAMVIGNQYVSMQVKAVIPRIENGESLSDSLKNLDFLPSVLVNMITVGEKTGELERTMEKVSAYYDAEYDMAVDRTVNRLSPAILLLTAAFAGFIVIAMYLAMFSMYGGM